ncbi:hypothetical protein [Zooshikella ganghwensis]|uniref:hypothetical protein n=1 Tax=Zooshikella ganghwensis TaxID=202772 RepID=UPI0012F9076F|nr:hypothetical protein [Zooshikella ganghwensis]
MQKIKYWLLTILTFIWCVLLPFFWAYNLSRDYNINYLECLGLYIPQVIIAGLTLAILLCIWLKKPGVTYALFSLSLVVPILNFCIVNKTYGTWVVTSLLLGLTGWNLRSIRAISQSS